MTSEATHLQFSRQTWEAVNEQARRCLVRREFCAEQSQIQNLRCVHFEPEMDAQYGKQLWYFEAIGVDHVLRRHALFGAIEFSVQYGLLEPSHSALFEDADHRQRFLYNIVQATPNRPWNYPSTRFWVRITATGIAMLSLFWAVLLVRFLTQE